LAGKDKPKNQQQNSPAAGRGLVLEEKKPIKEYSANFHAETKTENS
jgi:hypothetical protein